jgi:hypothetical protein
MAAPMPREAPVTIATLLVLSVIFLPFPDERSYIDALTIVVSSLAND